MHADSLSAFGAGLLAANVPTCAQVGHEWRFIGGKNAGCCNECSCSVPVHKCARCGDCDYGDNSEAQGVRRECEETLQWLITSARR